MSRTRSLSRRCIASTIGMCLASVWIGAQAASAEDQSAVDTDAPASLTTDAESPADALQAAADALAEAEARKVQAEAAYSRMRHSNRPRGAAREAIVRERTESQRALLDARARYDELKHGSATY